MPQIQITLSLLEVAFFKPTMGKARDDRVTNPDGPTCVWSVVHRVRDSQVQIVAEAVEPLPSEISDCLNDVCTIVSGDAEPSLAGAGEGGAGRTHAA